MSKLRWKWIGYHAYSNILTLLLAAAIVYFVLPPGIFGQISAGAVVQMVFLTVGGATLLGLACGISFTRNIRGRLEEVSVGAKNLAYGNLKYRLPFTDDGELGDIALAFNDMADRLETQVAALQKLAEENEELIQKTKSAAVTEERQRLARELHDAVSQQLFAISMTAATASRLIEQKPEKCASMVKNIEEASSKAQAEMRALLLQLRPVTLENQGLVDAVSSLAEELQAKQGMRIDLDLEDVALPATMENQLYRVVQEGLSNVLRHAAADQVKIRLAASERRRIQLRIEDNGQGFDVNEVSKTSYGLQGIRERIASLGGTVDWLSYPGEGTRLEVRLPIAIKNTQDSLEKEGNSIDRTSD